MADVLPNQKLIRARKQLEIDELKVNLQRNDIHKIELQDSIDKIETNREATLARIDELEEELKNLLDNK